MTLLMIAAVAVLLVGAVVVLLRRSQRPDEAARFQHASELTRTWARAEPTQVQVPSLPDQRPDPDAAGPAATVRD
jgi:acyl-CoA synthetase (AMP-forming)/AMP-acid ligase II